MTYAKLKLTATIKVETGLHIGTSNAFAAIGATDSPVIKDSVTHLPIIPGSSIKGKMRTLLSRSDKNSGGQADIHGDSILLKRLFGSSNDEAYRIGRLIFRDAFLSNKQELDKKGVKNYTEVKFENTINRISAMATPRQIERVIRDSEFSFELIYDVLPGFESEVKEDFQTIKAGLDLLELDYLGGSGSRGYGKVLFQNVQVASVFGDYDVSELEKIIG